MRPEPLLGDARLQMPLHHPHRRLAGRDRAAHGLDLVRGLERAHELHDLLAVVQLEAQGLERQGPRPVGLVDREPAVAAAVAAQQIGDLGRPAPGMLGHAGAAVKKIPGARRPDLVDQVQRLGEMGAAVEIEDDHRPLGRDEGVADRVVQAPDLHVGAVGGVAEVDRIGEDSPGVVAPRERRPQAGEALGPERLEVGRLELQGPPFLERQLAGSEVAERAMARPTAGGVDDLGAIAGQRHAEPRNQPMGAP